MEIRAFRGWRYRAGAEDVSNCIAPPYDVLSGEDKQMLLARSDRNIVAVDLPHCPASDVGADELYVSAARRLDGWKRQEVLVQEEAPALYAYEQSYAFAGREYVRRALICGLRATPLGRDVLPHEHTRPGPKADRLKLTQQTRMQLSPIFGFFSDPSGSVGEFLCSAARGEPVARGKLGEVGQTLWAVTDADAITAIVDVLREVPAFIADGHHRYTTALNYRDELRAAGRIDDDHEANFVMFALVAADDPGLLILPTHRMISGLKPDFRLAELARNAAQFTWSRHGLGEIAGGLDETGGWLRRLGPGSIGFVEAGSDDVWIARLTDRRAMRLAAPQQVDAWRELDVAILHTLIVDEAMAPWRTERMNIDYTPHLGRVLEACGSGEAQLAAILQGVSPSEVEAIARAGASMPPKSTYFYPKLATGMVLKPLE